MKENFDIKIAVITEDLKLQDYVVMLLIGEDYQVKAFNSQYDALAALEQESVDLIISEFQSSAINGLEICKTLRGNFLYNLIPMIFLTPDTEILSPAKLAFAGADDYVKRSAIKDELFIKVKLNLNRIARYQGIHSTTRLPGQSHLLKELQKRIDFKEPFAIARLSIGNFKEFTYAYGFDRGNEVLKSLGALMVRFVKAHGSAHDFIAHIEEHTFILITAAENVDMITRNIITSFDASVTSFYNETDSENGFIMTKDRLLRLQKSPFMNIHAGALINEYLPAFAPNRIMQIVEELHREAQKETGKSTYIKEEKKNLPLTSF